MGTAPPKKSPLLRNLSSFNAFRVSFSFVYFTRFALFKSNRPNRHAVVNTAWPAALLKEEDGGWLHLELFGYIDRTP